jgi:hypothetical protein
MRDLGFTYTSLTSAIQSCGRRVSVDRAPVGRPPKSRPPIRIKFRPTPGWLVMGNAVPNCVIGWSSALTGRWLKMRAPRQWSSRTTGTQNNKIVCQVWHQSWRPPESFPRTAHPPAERGKFGCISLKYICRDNLPANLGWSFYSGRQVGGSQVISLLANASVKPREKQVRCQP